MHEFLIAVSFAESILLASNAPAGFVLGFVVMLLVGLAAKSRARRRQRTIAEARDAVQVLAGYGVVVVGEKGNVLDTNATARELLWRDATRSELRTLPEPIRLLLSEGSEQRHVLRVGEGRLLDLLISASVCSGTARGIVVRDVTEERRGREHLLQLAHYDSLTGLGNRRLFIDRLELATRQCDSNRAPRSPCSTSTSTASRR